MNSIKKLKKLDEQVFDREETYEYLFDRFYDLILDGRFKQADEFIEEFIKEDFSLSVCIFFLEITLKYKNILSNRQKLFDKTYNIGNNIMLEDYLEKTLCNLK
jgi:hypothetical protein